MKVFYSWVLVLFGLLSWSLEAQTRTISVTATAHEEIVPQSARVSVFICLQEKDAKKAYSSVFKEAEDLSESLQEQKGMNDLDLMPLQVDTWWDKEKGRYAAEACQEISFRLDSLAYFEEVMEDVFKDGVSRVSSVELLPENPENANLSLQAKAIAEARSKAESLATDFGLKLGKPISVEVMEVEPSSAARLDGLYEYQGLALTKVVRKASVKVSFELL
jgi:uncharacterized protein YggE